MMKPKSIRLVGLFQIPGEPLIAEVSGLDGNHNQSKLFNQAGIEYLITQMADQPQSQAALIDILRQLKVHDYPFIEGESVQ